MPESTPNPHATLPTNPPTEPARPTDTVNTEPKVVHTTPPRQGEPGGAPDADDTEKDATAHTRKMRREAMAREHARQGPEDQLRAEDIARMTILPDTPDHVEVVTVGPSGKAGPSYTFEDRGGRYPHHPGGAYMPSEKDQAEAEENARKARRRDRD